MSIEGFNNEENYYPTPPATEAGAERRCPKCGYVMCQQFDSKPVNALAEIAIPNGQYVCYRCTDANDSQQPAAEPPQDTNCLERALEILQEVKTEWTGEPLEALQEYETRIKAEMTPSIFNNVTTTPAAEHSPFPLPLRVCGFPRSASDVPWSVTDFNGVVIADVRTEEIANLFVRAVNEREELIAALREVRAMFFEHATPAC